MLRVSPGTYNAVIHDYQTPLVGVMEYGLVAAVVFHGLNGIRVILVDFWSQGPRYQRVMFWVVGAVFVVVMVPAGVVIGVHMWEHVR